MQNAISLFNQAFYLINSTDLANNDEKTIEILVQTLLLLNLHFFR